MSENASVREAASFLGYSEQYVRKLIREDILPAEKTSGRWVLPWNAVVIYKSKGEISCLEVSDHKRRGAERPQLNALSFFSGAMGMDIGLERAGIHTLLACEIDKATCKTIKTNRPDIALIGDLQGYSAADILAAAGLAAGSDVDLMVGGPPCQAFSSAGKRQGFSDARGNVFLTFIDRILEVRPRFAVIENVRGLLSAPLEHRPHRERGNEHPPLMPEERAGGALHHILNRLRGAGYGVSFNLYDSANYGAPQRRERVIIVCSRDGEELPYLQPTHAKGGLYGLPRWRTVREVFTGLEGETHEHVKFPEKRLKYYRMLKAGQNWRNLPEELKKEAMGKSYYAGGGKTGFLRRVSWDKPSPTLVTHPAMPATDLCHPQEDRPLSVQEYKRIQQFPDDWVIEGKTLDKYRQIGNAVPSSLGEAIGRLLVNHLAGRGPVEYPDFPYSRYRSTAHAAWEIEFKKNAGQVEAQPSLFAA